MITSIRFRNNGRYYDDGIDEVLFNEILANTDNTCIAYGHSWGELRTLLADAVKVGG